MNADTEKLAQLGDAAAWALQRAIEAFGREHPNDAAELMAGVKAGAIRLRLTVESGGGQPACIIAAAIDSAGTVWELARMSIGQLSLN